MVMVHLAFLTMGMEMAESPDTFKPSFRATDFHVAETLQSGGWMFTKEGAWIRGSTL